MRVLNRPYASLRICLIALSAPTFMMEISAPETGLPWLSRTAPVTVPRLALLALTLGACRHSDAHNKVRSTPKVLALNLFLIARNLLTSQPKRSKWPGMTFGLRKWKAPPETRNMGVAASPQGELVQVRRLTGTLEWRYFPP